jgi:hypothetical protein
MDQPSLRVYLLNTLTLMMSFTNLEAKLKIMLLLISIIYTSMKIWDWVQIRINGKDEDNSKKNAQD